MTHKDKLVFQDYQDKNQLGGQSNIVIISLPLLNHNYNNLYFAKCFPPFCRNKVLHLPKELSKLSLVIVSLNMIAASYKNNDHHYTGVKAMIKVMYLKAIISKI